jgi:hypothetical protein
LLAAGELDNRLCMKLRGTSYGPLVVCDGCCSEQPCFAYPYDTRPHSCRCCKQRYLSVGPVLRSRSFQSLQPDHDMQADPVPASGLLADTQPGTVPATQVGGQTLCAREEIRLPKRILLTVLVIYQAHMRVLSCLLISIPSRSY